LSPISLSASCTTGPLFIGKVMPTDSSLKIPDHSLKENQRSSNLDISKYPNVGTLLFNKLDKENTPQFYAQDQWIRERAWVSQLN